MTTPFAVPVRPLESADECHAASALIADVWGTPPEESPAPGELLVALRSSGNYVVGAFARTGELLGTAVAWLGHEAGEPFLHSHIACVAAASRGLGVGFAMKQHQRRWAQERGLPEIRWTFDPLVRANAWFNLTRLGGVGARYLEDHYGVLADGINAGNATDRLEVRWSVDTAPPPPSRHTGSPKGAYPILDVDRVGDPVPIAGAPEGSDLAVWLPEDIVAMRARDPGLARAWRAAQRAALVPAFAAGYRATGATADGWLLLHRPTAGGS